MDWLFGIIVSISLSTCSFFILLGEIVHPSLSHALKSISLDLSILDNSEGWIDYYIIIVYIYLRVVSSFILLEKWRDRYWRDRLSFWPRFKIDYSLDLYDSRSLDNSEGWIDYLELFFLYLYLCVFSFFILLGEIVHPPLGHASKSIIADRDLYDSRSFDLSERWIDYLELLFLYIYLRVVSSFILLEKWRDRYWKDRPSSSWPPFKID